MYCGCFAGSARIITVNYRLFGLLKFVRSRSNGNGLDLRPERIVNQCGKTPTRCVFIA